ncbi:hypothetical protein LR48_Vigan06g038200 [Vigna angularis]|uniref:Tetratricopeptide SHNi-TPR domain-containing protein n=2 Tax=Phaseolus angularis TaxID=3914 RepID=A0A0L9UQU9_PHAAN|nr:NASP-related protein sim3 [Vigna angularis]KOM45076.1 hypothetical protein LR48_Vigan06g038200 [Vigna angularis]BAU00158.1 hypothetical protein VIGAN_10172500 [Vigna angularis var. angularis]
MAEEAPASETSVTMPRLEEAVAVDETLNSSEKDKSGISVNASTAHGVEESVSKAEASVSDPQKSLELANELMEKGNLAIKENDFGEAADNFSRALEIRVSHYGELAPECVHTYYKYGCALLYKAQEEADPLADVPKKEDGSQHDSTKEGPAKSSVNAESSTASFSSNTVQDSADQGEAVDDGSTKNDEEEGDEASDAEDLAEADEDETDLDLAWKMLDIARAIVEKQSVNTIEQVDILSTLADVALEREDFETSLSDYQKALSILEQLVEPDDRKIADLNFRICLCLEVGSKAQEAIIYCQKATSVCKARLHRLTNEVKSCSDLTSVSELTENVPTDPNSDPNNSIVDKQSEIETLKGLSSELERKLEDLQQLVSNPKSILAEILGIAAAKAGNGKESSLGMVSSSQLATVKNNGGFDSPSISTAHTNGSGGVTHLGVVGRGVKRASNASSSEGSTPKKPALESTEDKGDESAC